MGKNTLFIIIRNYYVKKKITNLKNYEKELKPYIKIDKKFDDTEIQEYKFYQYNSPISINDIVISLK